MKIQHRKIDIVALAPLLLFTVLALCVIMVLLMGAHVYETAVERDQQSYDHRTAAQYLSNRVHQLDREDAWFIGDFQEAQPQETGDTLFFRETIQGEVYYTRIYCYDGYLYELSSIADESFDPANGEKILALNGLTFCLEDGLLKIRYQHADGEPGQLLLHLRNGTVVAP